MYPCSYPCTVSSVTVRSMLYLFYVTEYGSSPSPRLRKECMLYLSAYIMPKSGYLRDSTRNSALRKTTTQDDELGRYCCVRDRRDAKGICTPILLESKYHLEAHKNINGRKQINLLQGQYSKSRLKLLSRCHDARFIENQSLSILYCSSCRCPSVATP
jgi:hypothetical protein